MNRLWLFLLIVIAIVAAAVVFGATIKFESRAPGLAFEPDLPDYLGPKQSFRLTASDEGQGLRSVRVVITQDDRSHVLAEESWPGQLGLLGSGQTGAELEVTLDPRQLELTDGPARLSALARDHSWRESFHGNKTELAREIIIDTRPPAIDVISRLHYLTRGGCGLVVYRVSEEGRSGVALDDLFFPSLPVEAADPRLRQCLFSLPYNLGPEKKPVIKAFDLAGNESFAAFNHSIRSRRLRHRKINITPAFLTTELAEFRAHYPDLPGNDIEAFLVINRDIRRQSNGTIREITLPLTPQKLWEGAFIQLANSARTAGFADQRTYFFEGREIDRQVHMGLDLASTAQADVPAGNRGRVVLADYLGIYGQTVILDHGQGLYSLYGHLSSLAVVVGQELEAGEKLGRTGKTGLAGGDHLHMAMICHGVYVNPLEWLDGRWIEHNITAKVEAALRED